MTNKHPLTDEMCKEIQFEDIFRTQADCMRVAYDLGYTQGLENAADLITCIQRKDSPATPITLEELEAMRPQVVDLPQANSDVCGEEGIKRAQQRTFEENDELMRKLSAYDLRAWAGYAQALKDLSNLNSTNSNT